MSASPTLREERRLLREGHLLVAGMDEVGRGALAGPVSVGVVVVGPTTRTAPTGLRDSKLLTPAARDRLAPLLRRWAPAWAVGHAHPQEIDDLGIIAALRLAGLRALGALGVRPGIVLLDGAHDWLTPPAPDLLDLLPGTGDAPGAPQHTPRLPTGDTPEGALPDALDGPVGPRGTFDDGQVGHGPGLPASDCPPVRTLVKADQRCAAVAAASVLAKTVRDAMMVERSLTHPGYRWDENKGYAAPEHLAALRLLGASEHHRRSWRLPGTEPTDHGASEPRVAADAPAGRLEEAGRVPV